MRKAVLYGLLPVLLMPLLACGPLQFERTPIPGESRQMLLVIGDGVDQNSGRMQRFERRSAREMWQPVGVSYPVTLGRNGLAWGRGLHTINPGQRPVKREGDGRSPAGIFTLGEAFGTDSLSPNLKLDYLPIVPGMEGVDDPASRYYNQIISRDSIAHPDWTSSEVLSRYPVAYALGVVVQHNTTAVRAGAGSLIFIHIQSSPGKPTAGCTAMTLPDMRETAQWLDASEVPVLVQLPWPWYRNLRLIWALPRLR